MEKGEKSPESETRKRGHNRMFEQSPKYCWTVPFLPSTGSKSEEFGKAKVLLVYLYQL